MSSPEGTFAIPLAVIEHDASGPPLAEVDRLMREYAAEGLVLGLPISMDGTASAQTRSALDFAVRAAAYLDAVLETPPGVDVPEGPADAGRRPPELQPFMARVVLWDERLSSWEAQRATSAGDLHTRRKSGKQHPIDAHAAAVILQSFLDAHAAA